MRAGSGRAYRLAAPPSIPRPVATRECLRENAALTPPTDLRQDYERYEKIPSARGPDSRGVVQHPGRSAGSAGSGSASGHRSAHRPRRPGAPLPDGADRPGSEPGPRDRDSRSGPRRLPGMAAHSALPCHRSGARPRYPGAHLLQVRRREPGGQPQAEHRSRPGLLQQGSGHHAHRHRDRGRPVGVGARLRGRSLRSRDQGVHGAGQLRSETLPQGDDGDLRRAVRGEPERSHQLGARDPRRQSRQHRQSRHRDQRGGGGRGATCGTRATRSAAC